jgi:hypothetical protein
MFFWTVAKKALCVCELMLLNVLFRLSVLGFFVFVSVSLDFLYDFKFFLNFSFFSFCFLSKDLIDT